MSDSSPRGNLLVTGTSTGIGRVTACLLAREGFRVFAGVRRDEDARSLRAEGLALLEPLLLDVTDESSVERAAKDVSLEVGAEGLSGLVNNAGIGFGGALEFVDVDEVRRGFEVNVFGVLAVLRSFLPLLQRPGGRVVNVSSGAGKASTPLLGPYCASKFALEALSDALRVELRQSGIRVSVIEPGFVDTPMQSKGRSETERKLAELPPEAPDYYRHATIKMQQNLERYGRSATAPEVVARAIRRALTSRRPRIRYAVGPDSKLLVPLSRWLPDRAKDAIFGRIQGL